MFDANQIKGDAGYDAMMEWLTTALSYLRAQGKPYYFVTHEPFGSFKKDKTTVWGISKDDMKKAGTEEGHTILNSGSTPEVLSVLQTYPPVSVLCADTHHYEKGKITGEAGSPAIHQEIVGSGGASYNTYTSDWTPFSLGGPFIYSMMSEPFEMYGFLSIPTQGQFDFLAVREWSAVGGARSRRRRALKKMTRRRARR